MSDSAKKNVIHLGDYGQMRKNLLGGPGTRALRDTRELAASGLKQSIGLTMERIDDALYACGGKSVDPDLRRRYFDAMHELRISRRDIEDDFIEGFYSRFNQGIPRSVPGGDLPADFEDSDAGTTGETAIEEELVISNMVARARLLCKQSLFMLDKRIGFLIRDPDLQHWHNPVGPEAVCSALREAVQRVSSDSVIRQVIFDVFDATVIDWLDSLYTDLNQQLINLGVMPELNLREDAADHPPAAPHPVAGETANTSPTGGIQATVSQSPTRAAERLQPDTPGEPGDIVSDKVSRIFDCIRDDRSIPDSLRGLIARLQAPILRVALLDDSFFSRPAHPARRLLNRLGETACGWNEHNGSNDPVYRKIAAIVDRVATDFADDIALFTTAREDLERYLDVEEERARIRADRSIKVMQGEERLAIAKATTMDEIAPRIAAPCNAFIREFISSHWKNLLFISCARQGPDSDSWKQAVATMDDLIWSVQPKHTAEDRKRLIALQPGLLANLRAGMERLAVPPTERDDFIARLVLAHGRAALARADKKPAGAAEPSKHTATPVAADSARTPPQQQPKHTPVDKIEDEYAALVENMVPGNWLEFTSPDGKIGRARLSWISPITQTYLFTDRQGLKAGSYSASELAALLRRTQARPIDPTPLADRAITRALEA